MAKLHFEYDQRSGNYEAEYNGLKIKAEQDSDCSNPWHDSDGFSPLLWYSDSLHDESGKYDITSPLACFSDYQLARKWPELCRALGVDPAELTDEIKREQKDYGGRLGDFRRDKLEELLHDMRPSGWSSACDYFEALEALWRLAGVEALDFERNGYSQGDSVRGLLVALPAWRNDMGITAGRDMTADLEAQADVFGAWLFGDCYGYIIESADGETLDSCWGFIGDDMEKSGLAEAAQSMADYIISKAAERKTAKLKELIRNHVPLELRPALLAEAAKLESV